MTALPSALVCAGCGASPDAGDPYPFRCPHRGGDDADHVVARVLDLAGARRGAAHLGGASLADEPRPFVRYRALLHSHHRAASVGIGDDRFVALVADLDRRVESVDGRGFRSTPLHRDDVISDALGFTHRGGVWVKDETGNVAGSHKGRHLFGVLLHLVVSRLAATGSTRPDSRSLAIASCGNAALAAATLAAAAEWPLRVFVPVDADEWVVGRLRGLGATLVACERRAGVPGDPTVERLLGELQAGALAFTCQGNLNGLAIEGGETLGWELAEQLAPLDPPVGHLVVQVGGGALASSCAQALAESRTLGLLGALPRVHTVQTAAAHPLQRAFDAVRRDLPVLAGPGDADRAVAAAVRHRSDYMWPWETEPRSVATGILDDETYDWAAIVAAMLRTGGQPVVASEERLVQAHGLGRRAGYAVSPTGTAGLAGLLELRDAGAVGSDERVAVLFTGASRPSDPEPPAGQHAGVSTGEARL